MTTYDQLTSRTAYPQGVGFPAEPIDYIGATLYGILSSGDIYSSPDHGTSWFYVCEPPTGVTARRLIATSDSEVLLGATGGVWKSSGWGTASVSWAQELDVTVGGTLPTAALLEACLDGSGSHFIATHYSQADRSDSRYAWISTDSGANWSQVWDSETDAPSADPTDSHIHAACYDPWDDKWYICEGHGDSIGIYVSTNDGTTWAAVEDNGLNAASTPTVCVATDDGIVFGSDNGNDGIWTLERGNEPAGLQWVWEWESSYGAALNGFANRGARDSVTGIVYVGFQSDRSDLGAVIGASDGVSAAGVWEDTNLEGEYSNVVAYDGNVAGTSSRDSLNIYFDYTSPGGVGSLSGYWYSDGTSGTAASAPYIAAYNTADDIDVRVDFAPDAYSGTQSLFGRTFGSVWPWRIYLSTAAIAATISDPDTGNENITGGQITTGLGVSAGDRIHLRVVFNLSAGSVVFYGRDTAGALANDLSSDANWTTIATDSTITSNDFKQPTSDGLNIAARDTGFTSNLAGYFYRTMFIHGTTYAGGTAQFDADFSSLTPAEIAAGAFTESSANAATVTFQGSGWTASAGTAAAATLHGDQLFRWIQENYAGSFTSLELVGALNELNGTNGVEYAQARGTFLGVDPAG